MTFKLSDVCIGGGSYGIAAPAVEYSSDLPTYLRITDINDDGTLNFDGLKSVDDSNSAKYKLVPNDIVFARTGASTGRNYFFDGSDGDFVYAGFLIKFSIDPTKVNPQYIKYYCRSKAYFDWVASFNTGSTRGNINAQTLGNMPILDIPREQQNVLVDTLSAFDALIAESKKINHHLAPIMLAIDSSPDIRRGKRVSRSSARRRFSKKLFSISSYTPATLSQKSSSTLSGGTIIAKPSVSAGMARCLLFVDPDICDTMNSENELLSATA